MTYPTPDRPVLTEIEITPAMIEAGAGVASRFVDREWEALSDVTRVTIVRDVYAAMRRAKIGVG